MEKIDELLGRWFRCGRCIVAATVLAASAASQIHVDPDGSFYPEGTSDRPFQLIETAGYYASTAAPGNSVRLAPGSYAQTGVMDTPMRLTASGPAIIGAVGEHDELSLGIYTMNTHLFGDGSPGGLICPCLPTVGEVDDGRPLAIGSYLHSIQGEYDVICLQEVWELENLTLIRALTQGDYPYYHWASNSLPYVAPFPVGLQPGCLNSGLLIMSKYPLTDVFQGSFGAESPLVYVDPVTGVPGVGEEAATKGWLQCTVMVNKNGSDFPIGLFTTHTEAKPSHYGIRDLQMAELSIAIGFYKALHPARPVFVTGDFNVAEVSTNCDFPTPSDPDSSFCDEYTLNLEPKFDAFFNDAHPHVRDYFEETDPLDEHAQRYTATQSNALYSLFNADSESERLDYILYEPGSLTGAFAITPTEVFVDYGGVSWTGVEEEELSCEEGSSMTESDLSDHQAVAAQFKIYYP